jgi:hypothetical protein
MSKSSWESRFELEGLEGRQLLSALPALSQPIFVIGAGGASAVKVIDFNQIPTAAQSGLDTLAGTDQLTAPTSTQPVTLGNSNGLDTYSVTLKGTGTSNTLTVDQNGNLFTPAVRTQTTFGTLGGNGTNSNSAAASEITAIAQHLGVSAPSSSTVVHVTTGPDSSLTYNVNLPGFVSIVTNPPGAFSIISQSKRAVTVDGNGNPVGNQKIPFSVIPTAIQNELNAQAPTGETLPSDSTKTVTVATADGQTTYAVVFKGTGIRTRITINSAGQLTDLPTSTNIEYQAVPTAAQTALQALVTSLGSGTTLNSTQSVSVYTESDGTSIYTTSVPVNTALNAGLRIVFPNSTETISVDEDGNPTVLPDDAPAPDFPLFFTPVSLPTFSLNGPDGQILD